MKKAICMAMMCLMLTGCIPLVVGGLVGYEVAKSKAEGDVQHKEKMDLEKAKLELMKKEAGEEAKK